MSELVLQTRALESRIAAAGRRFTWSVRREVWENRFLWVAPLVVAGVVLLVFMLTGPVPLDADKAKPSIETRPYDFSAFMLVSTGFMVSVFYCLDALYGDRRDRSVLFWKALPVSDAATVLSKMAVPMIVMPVIVFVVAMAAYALMLAANSALLLAHPGKIAVFWAQLKFSEHVKGVLYCIPIIALWYAPIYAALLLVSAWARRAPFLWAGLPLFLACIGDKLFFNAKFVLPFIDYRMFGWYHQAFGFKPNARPMSSPIGFDPAKFLTTPGLWWGLLFAAVFLFAATRLRRYRGPI